MRTSLVRKRAGKNFVGDGLLFLYNTLEKWQNNSRYNNLTEIFTKYYGGGGGGGAVFLPFLKM